MYKLDRTAFRKHSVAEAKAYHASYDSTDSNKRLAEGYFLSISAYGYTLETVPRMDKNCFSMRKQS
jgi:hypothetical protein